MTDSDSAAGALIERARAQLAARPTGNRFLDLLEEGKVPRDRLGRLAGEQHRIISSDRRSFALLAARYPEPPAGDLFLSLAQGEGQALRLLPAFAAALGWGDQELRAYEPQPLAQAYPAYLAWQAVNGTSSAVALAMLVNLDEWGTYCGRSATALNAGYGLPEDSIAFFRFFAAPPPEFGAHATAVIAAGLAAGEDPADALRAARMLHAYEDAFWASLADGLD